MAMRESRFVRLEFVALEQRTEATLYTLRDELAGRLSPENYQYQCGVIEGLKMALNLCAEIEKGSD